MIVIYGTAAVIVAWVVMAEVFHSSDGYRGDAYKLSAAILVLLGVVSSNLWLVLGNLPGG